MVEKEFTHELRLMDAIKGLESLPSKSVDLIITDPAYESLEKWRNMGTTSRLKKWFDVVPNAYFEAFFKECYRVLKGRTLIYVFCDEDTSDVVKPTVRNGGFRNELGYVYWKKCGKPSGAPCETCGVVPRLPGSRGMGYPYGSVIEKIVIGRKGVTKIPHDRTVRNALDYEEVWTTDGWEEFPAIRTSQSYPTEKPVPLLMKLIAQATLEPNSLIVDPFAGSGSTGEAAYSTGHRFIGFDTSEKAKTFFENRKDHWAPRDPMSKVAAEVKICSKLPIDILFSG